MILRQGGGAGLAAGRIPELHVLPSEDSLLGVPTATAVRQWAVAGALGPNWVRLVALLLLNSFRLSAFSPTFNGSAS